MWILAVIPLLSLSIEDNEQVSVEERKELDGNWQKVFAVVTSPLFL